jgi:signal transduction histidine kinase
MVALVEHDTALAPDLLDREIGAAARLAVDNERLEATIRARLRELRASRTRIVATADTARGRLERDLHDGAQQRLLTVSFELRLLAAVLAAAGAAAESRAAIDWAMNETDAALSDLRDLAHGIHPVVLTEDGLDGALASLAETTAVPLVVMGGPIGRCAGPAELAAYLGVVEAIQQAEIRGVERVDVSVERGDETMRLTIAGPTIDERQRVRIEDRVGAAGGHLDVSQSGPGHSLLALELPCA